MLSLTRKIGEKVIVSDTVDTIEFVIVAITGGRVKLAISAPDRYRITRPDMVNTHPPMRIYDAKPD